MRRFISILIFALLFGGAAFGQDTGSTSWSCETTPKLCSSSGKIIQSGIVSKKKGNRFVHWLAALCKDKELLLVVGVVGVAMAADTRTTARPPSQIARIGFTLKRFVSVVAKPQQKKK